MILKEMFGTHGISDMVISENGPRYASNPSASLHSPKELHVMSSAVRESLKLHNGEAERRFGTAK